MTNLPITHSALHWLERILSERFGHEWNLFRNSEGHFRLKIKNNEGAIIFDKPQSYLTQTRSDLPCTHWNSGKEGYESLLGGPLPAPGVSQLPYPLIEQQGQDFLVHYDILGLTYWMLARIEEIGRTDLDEHGRFQATSSHAFKNQYLERPIVDEWLNLLGQVIKKKWPNLELKNHTFQIHLSHDVDRPSRFGFASPYHLFRRIGGDLTRRHIKSALCGPLIRIKNKAQLHPADPFNTFDWIMDHSESLGLKSAFYFICGQTNKAYDGEYDIEHPAIRDLLRKINARGHEIGLHPSYNTYKDPVALRMEADRLRLVCSKEGIEQTSWGGRMHYLRWEHPTTLSAWDTCGMNYDSSLSYADHPGFRCGTCFEYPGFDAINDRILSVRVRPLILMEASILSDKYMGLTSPQEATVVLKRLKSTCFKARGQFTLLWHNSELFSAKHKNIFKEIIKGNTF